MSASKKVKLDPYPIPYAKINFKWIKDLNVIPETIKFLEENIGGKLSAISHGKDFFGSGFKAKAKIAKINK